MKNKRKKRQYDFIHTMASYDLIIFNIINKSIKCKKLYLAHKCLSNEDIKTGYNFIGWYDNNDIKYENGMLCDFYDTKELFRTKDSVDI